MLYIHAFELPQEHTLLKSEGVRLLVATMTTPLLNSLRALIVSFYSHL
jgi:hypothetical protein